MPKKNDISIVHDGPCIRIVYAVKKDKSMPAKEELDRRRKKKSEKRKIIQMEVLFEQYAKAGRLPKNKFDKYHGSPIHKFKRYEAYPYRVTYFFYKNTLVLAHLFEKEGDASVSDNIEIAERIRDEHIEQKERE